MDEIVVTQLAENRGKDLIFIESSHGRTSRLVTEE
jgi:hypothetical protein